MCVREDLYFKATKTKRDWSLKLQAKIVCSHNSTENTAQLLTQTEEKYTFHVGNTSGQFTVRLYQY